MKRQAQRRLLPTVGLGPEFHMGPFIHIQSNPIHKYQVLNQTRKLCATNHSSAFVAKDIIGAISMLFLSFIFYLMLTFNRGKAWIVKSS